MSTLFRALVPWISAQAASYVELVKSEDTRQFGEQKAKGFWGAGVDVDITSAGLKAVLSALSTVD